ncbi:hypothetical protein WJX75_007110 [Coccomyxa subellipsoidea]|uniref:Uncharacterized protein n=1 Tax=Coccomyxa subellipsoidea TaxID=248742 RepID=A0ABR2YMF2_9CHLO
MQVTVENQNGDGGKQAGDQVHKPVGKPAADDAMLTEPEEDVANKSFMAELVRGKKQLEMMMLEAQKMRNGAMELRVLTAIAANRMTRLDNPIMNNKLMALKSEADELLRSED